MSDTSEQQTTGTAKIDDGGAGQFMRLRDYFAAVALAGLLSRSSMEVPHCVECCQPGEDAGEHYADISYRYADAMILQRKGK